MKKFNLVMIFIFASIVSYGVISAHAFHRQTFLSQPVDCMPHTFPSYITVRGTLTSAFRYVRIQLFGKYCATY